MPVPLTPRERAHLKARAHALEPKVMVGHGGVTPAVIAEIDRALTAHELIKVKILGDDREARETMGEEICAGTDSASVHRVGKVLVLWRPKPERKVQRSGNFAEFLAASPLRSSGLKVRRRTGRGRTVDL